MLRKYPRTPHVQGSRLQPGDHDLAQVPFAELAGRALVVEEKLDGANAAISFDTDGTLLLQSRGHYLSGGPREKQFAPFKAWAAGARYALWPVIKDRFIVYGEWLYAKHTVFYDALPHHFCEFDVFDRQAGTFLSTRRRRELLAGLPIASVPVLAEDVFTDLAELTALAGPSTCRTESWREALREAAVAGGADPERVVRETDPAEEMEGLYLKLEDADAVLGRYKWVRPSFHTAILDSGSHWQDRPIVANRLRT
ncbi:RNA ligase family protein [Dactylosporangium matsuzakiense]|uniref:DNA ligase III n=1 Tax=Dactylosporangium matsuzakiense TaxID=53360 RepID=A0A9W6KRS5_9ACTN|nr:RNA ligase family protein [Dactylosporangium matsuzakiense]UWZ44800.1 RNA ligase family protein [Dactylosporangium matsuzakiense]GLL06063.1 DNA ligase III [Dactylosporangium matsuzakiense]